MKKLVFLNKEIIVNDEIAVIGSSYSLLKKEYGKLIDGFENVVRFNRSPIVGYEKHVGNNENIRVVNPGVFENKGWSGRWDPKGQPRYFVKELKNTKVIKLGPWNKPENKISENIDSTSEAFNVEIQSLYRLWKYGQPSVGIAFIILLIKSGVTPHIFGFDTTNIPISHYWEERDTITPCHNMNVQKKYLLQLANDKIIKIYD